MSAGLKFECQAGCTACCEQRGFVYLSEEDVLRIAAHLQLSAEEFERSFCYRTKKRVRLRVPRDAQCTFLQVGGCSIHSVKPVQCRIFPFWPETVESRREWRKLAQYCPGIDKGPLVQIESARAQADEMRAGHPAMYCR